MSTLLALLLAIQATCNVIRFDGSAGPKASIDPQLAPFEKQLTRPPYSSLNTFKFVKSEDVVLKGDAETKGIAGGGSAKLIVISGETGRKKRISMTVKFQSEDKVVVDEGDAAIISIGPATETGTPFAAFTCKPQ